MPNLVVYVPVALARALEEKGITEELQRRACREALAGLPTEPARRLLPEHRADPKDKAAQEHGRKEPQALRGLCPHRVPLGTYCKRCDPVPR